MLTSETPCDVPVALRTPAVVPVAAACCETPLFPSLQGYPFLHAEMIHLHLTADSFSQTVDSAGYKASIPRFVLVSL